MEGNQEVTRVWHTGLFLKTALVHVSLETSPGVDDSLGSSGGEDPAPNPDLVGVSLVASTSRLRDPGQVADK